MGAYILAALISYLLGSVPAGFLAGKARGIDVRTVGSGNIGATNAFRVLGKTAGSIVLAVDGFKGFAAARWAPLLAILVFGNAAPPREHLALVAGVAAILGHNYTCWLKFKGGKGIATSGGVVMAWAPLACLTALALWFVLFVTTKFVSVASIAAALILPLAVWYFNGSPTMTGVMAALSALAIYKHKGNIQRLLNGTESRVGAKKDA
jgi:acyl phosphate:glycerol-3-phosphate acyltransferase